MAVTLANIALAGSGQSTTPLNKTYSHIQQNTTRSNLSTIIDNTNYKSAAPEFNSSPEYINFIDASSTPVGKFIPMKLRILDGPDPDNFGTTLTSMRLTVEDLSNTNQLAMIKTAILTTSSGQVIATAVQVGHELEFTGMNGPLVTAEDDDLKGKIIHIRVSLDETQVIDKTKLVFKITSATADPNGSAFTTPDAGGAQSDFGLNNRNRLNVTADRMTFTTPTSAASVGIGMFPYPVVSLIDLYGRIDLDTTTSSILITSTGMPHSQPPSIIVNGQAVLNSVEHTLAGGPFTLMASYSGWSAASNPFYITDTPTNSYRTSGSGNWLSNQSTPAIWEQYNGTSWLASNSPSYESSAFVFIRNGHTLNSADSFLGNISLNVLYGGRFNVNHDGILANLTIHNDGHVHVNEHLALKPSGTLTVRDRGNLTINYKYGNPFTSIWAGTENFHPASNLILKNWNESQTIISNETAISANVYGGYTAVFGNIICDFEGHLTENESVDFLATGVHLNLAHGNLIFRSNTTMQSDVRISTDGSVISGIGGNFQIEDTYAAHQKIKLTTSGDLDFTIKGSMILEAATLLISEGSNVSSTVIIEGDLNIHSTASLNFNSPFTTGSSTKINLFGDLSVSESGVLQNSNSSQNGILNFTGLGNGFTDETTQTIDIASNSTIENRHINFNIKNQAYVKLINQDFELGRNSGLTVETGGTLDFGFNETMALNVAISASQSGTRFLSQQGSTLKITSPEGISTLDSSGNVKTTRSNRSFHRDATFYFVGKKNQETGSGLPSSSSKKTVYVILDHDLLELRLTNRVGISDGGKLEIQRGIVIGERNNDTNLDFHGPDGQLVMTGGEYRISSLMSNPLTQYLPQLGKYSEYSLTGGTIHLNGNNALQILSGTPTYYNLKFSGHNNLADNYKGVSKAVEITNNITIAGNAIVDVKNNRFGGTATNLTMTDQARYITAGAGTKPDAVGIYNLEPNTTIEFSENSGIQNIRISNPVPNYANIVVSGSHVGTQSIGTGSNSFIQFQPNGSFTITEQGTFRLQNSLGFSGAHNTAISNTNNPTIILEERSTVEYNGSDQHITHFNTEYKNLTISGTGTKTLAHPTSILIGENLNVNASTLVVKTDEAISVIGSVNIDNAAHFNIENSGSLIQLDDTKVNSGKIAMIRKASIKHRDYVYWSSPISGFNVNNITPTNHIYKWDPTATNANNTQGNWLNATNEIMEPGRGYIVRAPDHHPSPTSLDDLNFTAIFFSSENGFGVPNNGEIHMEIKRGNNAQSDHYKNDNWNLVGNPYPSAISALEFLDQNRSIDGYVNLWKHGLPLNSIINPFYQNFILNYHQADYFIYNGLGSSDGPSSFNGHIAAGQSFMVNMVDGSEAASATVIFRNSIRNKGFTNNQFFKAAQAIDASESRHRIWLDLISPTMPTNRMLVGYIQGATINNDRLFDAKINLDGATDGLYTLLNGDSYIIQGRPLPFNDSDIIPLGLQVRQNENYVIAIAALDGLFEENKQTIYLKDLYLNFIHNLSNQPYSFNSESGTFNDRFEIVFRNQILSSTDVLLNAQNLSIVELNNGQVRFSVEHNLSIKSVEIIDLLGRNLFNLRGHSAHETYDLSHLNHATYIAKVQLSNKQVITKRFIKQ